jgi:phage tail tape-measure protein
MSVEGRANGVSIAAALAGAAAGAGMIGGSIGIVLGIVAAMVLDALVGWLMKALSDDIFRPQSSSIYMETASATFAGGAMVSPLSFLDYRDHGGHYRVAYDWEITR